ncbi:MAG TPA: hypothetical protein VH088_13065 [Terriglobales bacterium]|jgi:hypothetical protein|nr:hypothetical protein [Terriglobales bacterium]
MLCSLSNSQTLRIFKGSDGKLAGNGPLPPDQLRRLRAAKGKILEIVFAYLYSGRDQQAWRVA